MNKEFFNEKEVGKLVAACQETEQFGMHLSEKYGIQPVFRAFGILLGAWVAQQPGDHEAEGIAYILDAMKEGIQAQKDAMRKRS